MKEQPQTPTDPRAAVDSAEDAGDPIDVRVRNRARDRRWFAILLVVICSVMFAFFGYFMVLKAAGVDVDLRLAADAAAPAGERVLVDAEVLDPRSGNIRYTPDVYLELWRGGTQKERWRVQGTERRAIVMRAQPMELRVVHETDGPVQSIVKQVVKPGPARTSSAEGARRGGANPSAGEPGFRRVRSRDACGWRLEILAYGGVPVANVSTPTLFRLHDAAGAPVPDTDVAVKAGRGELQRVRTDSDGMAVRALRVDELSFVEATASCAAGEFYAGFETQPVYDGLAVTELSDAGGDIRATIQDSTQRRDARYDLRCDGVLRAYGVVPRSGEIEIPADRIGAVRRGTACRLQVYRGVFAARASHTVYPFQWGADSLAWDWAQQASGVGLVGLSASTRSLDRDDAAVDAWRAVGYRRIRVGIVAVLGFSLLLWFGLVAWRIRARRQVTDRLGEAPMIRSSVVLEAGTSLVLWSGWGAIVISLGSLYGVLWLMGL